MPLFSSSINAKPFSAKNLAEATLIATNQLGEAIGGAAILESASPEGNASALVVNVTTTSTQWREGVEVEVEEVDRRRVVVQEHRY